MILPSFALLLAVLPWTVHAWTTTSPGMGRSSSLSLSSSSTSASSSSTTLVRLEATAKSAPSTTTTHYYSTLLDGPCWTSLQARWASTNNNNDPKKKNQQASKVGQLQLVTGLLSDDGTRVIGMPVPKEENDHNDHDVGVSLQSGEVLQADSVARLPSQLSADQAAVTYAHVLTHVHSVLSVVEGVGGSPSSTVATPPRHVVIVGGNVDAIHAAQALHRLGSDVTVVSTTSPKVQPLSSTTDNNNNNKATLTVTDPSMGDVGFAQALGTFDALLDTLGNEQGSLDPTSSSVVALLKERHGCATYISTCTHAQELMAKEGVLWGPGKVKHYHSQLLSSTTTTMVAPPPHIGATVQTLLQAGLVWTAQNSAKQRQEQPSTPQVRSWDLARYMETTLWPSDNRGTATTRYGFPVPGTTSFDDNDEDEDDDEEMILEPPLTAGRISTTTSDNDRTSSTSGTTIVSKSPYIRRMDTVRELQRIEEEQLDCVLFLSAKFCRACKKVQLPYNTMARRRHNQEASSQDDDNNKTSLVFCQAEASGHAGKLVGRALGIDAVPTFVLYRQGQRYGDPLSITRLPSSQLEQALEALLDGSEPPAP